ncbi:MAG: histidine ammonia-lyase [Alphaproteobacteria bacterium]|nr:histidine ammonia-lyase [Alphaproteobacteria bacterium]
MQTFNLDEKLLDFEDISSFLSNTPHLVISHNTLQLIHKSRCFIDEKLKNSQDSFYGINTGFGYLYSVKISNTALEDLQKNLIRSHACGTGEVVPLDIIKLMVLLKLKSFAFGYSGVSIELVENIMYLFNNQVYPVIYTQGSLGASGDLAPLSHFSLPLIGEGDVFFNGQITPMNKVCENIKYIPITLKSKEGLALINGTQFMTAYGLYILNKFKKLLDWADVIGALSLVAYQGNLEPFSAAIHSIRPHLGQIKSAQNIVRFLTDYQSQLVALQDPYSFRCIPQVHGASWDVFEQVKRVFLIETNAVTDNPLVFPEENMIRSGGNFHGQPLAIHLDYLAIGMAEIGSISERRTYQLLSGTKGLPLFLTSNSGLQSGWMIMQYTAASLVSENKQLCTPASIDSIPSSNNQEDHVSMGANAATKAYKILQNLENILAIELSTSMQALGFRDIKQLPLSVNTLYKEYTKYVPFLKQDEFMKPIIDKSRHFLRNNPIV